MSTYNNNLQIYKISPNNNSIKNEIEKRKQQIKQLNYEIEQLEITLKQQTVPKKQFTIYYWQDTSLPNLATTEANGDLFLNRLIKMKRINQLTDNIEFKLQQIKEINDIDFKHQTITRVNNELYINSSILLIFFRMRSNTRVDWMGEVKPLLERFKSTDKININKVLVLCRSNDLAVTTDPIPRIIPELLKEWTLLKLLTDYDFMEFRSDLYPGTRFDYNLKQNQVCLTRLASGIENIVQYPRD